MTFQRGQSGNPRGRPRKERALTALLQTAGGRHEITSDGERRLRRVIAVDNIWTLLTHGRMTGLDGYEIKLQGKDYVELVKFVWNQVDGPAPALKADESDPEGRVIRALIIERPMLTPEPEPLALAPGE